MAGYTSYWDLRSPLGSAVFGLLLLASSVFVSLKLDTLTLERRRRGGRRRLLNRAGPRSRLLKLVLGGVLIPIATLSAAYLFELPNHQTPMALASLAVRSRLAKPEAVRAVRLADAVLRARGPSAKVQGILALQAMSPVDSVDPLLRILADDPTALSDASEYQALCAALAACGVQARTKLLERFNGVPPGERRSAPAPRGDVFERELATAQPEPKPGSNASRLPSFVLQTLLQMAVTEDTELLAFARQTAADDGWSDAVRGEALQLTAKLGGRDDLDGLFAYLDSPSALLRAHALRAIATLQARLSAAATKG